MRRKNRTASERREELIRILYERRSETSERLAIELDVSKRTILTDVSILTGSYPIETVRGNGGCIKIQDGFYTGRRFLRKFQREALEVAIHNAEGSVKTALQSILYTAFYRKS